MDNTIRNKTNSFYYDHRTYDNVSIKSFYKHSHSCYELILFIKGDATHVIEDRKYKLSKNDLILIKPLSYHYIQIDSNKTYERYNLLINAKALEIENIEAVASNYEVINLSSNAIALELFSKIDHYKNLLPDEEFKKVCILLIKELFYNLSAYNKQSKKYSTLSPILSDALNYINENLFTLKNISEISKILFVTDSYLFRMFKKELKTTPKKYILEKRLYAAQSMLSLGRTPFQVYVECGFTDYTVFYRNYVKFFGYPPSKEGL